MEWHPTTLVLGPGGIKGFLELGSLLYLEKQGVLKGMNTYVGVSIGAILGLLLVSGYTVMEVITVAFETNIFQDISSINLNEVKEKMGVMSNRLLKEKLVTCLQAKYGMVPTLNQLQVVTGLKFIAGTMNLTKGIPEYLSYETAPNLSCVDAVLMSANIPGLFYKIVYNGCLYIDGAFSNPIASNIVDDGHTDVLTLYISTKVEVGEDANPLLYMYACLSANMIMMRDMIVANASPRCKFIKLHTTVLDVTGFTVGNEEKSRMIVEGYETGKKFLTELYPHLLATEDPWTPEGVLSDL